MSFTSASESTYSASSHCLLSSMHQVSPQAQSELISTLKSLFPRRRRAPIQSKTVVNSQTVVLEVEILVDEDLSGEDIRREKEAMRASWVPVTPIKDTKAQEMAAWAARVEAECRTMGL